MHDYGDMDPELYPGHIFNFRGWRDVIGCVTVGPGMCGFLYVVSNNHTSILHSYGDNEPARYYGSDLDNAGHVTLPVTWPFDSPWGDL